MKTKFLTGFLLTAILCVMTVSALNFEVSTPSTFTKSVTSTTFTITNSELTSLDITVILPSSIVDGRANAISISTSDLTVFQLNAGESKQITLTRGDLPEEFDIGEFTKTITVTGKNPSNVSEERTATLKFDNSFCEIGSINTANLDLSVDISNLGEGDENEWMPLDKIEVDVTFDNNKNEDLNNVILEFGLIDKNTGENVASDLIWTSTDEEKVEYGDVDSDESADNVFSFQVDPSLDEGDYLLVIKAYPDGEEDTTCIDFSSDLESKFFETIKLSKEDASGSRAVVVDTEELSTPLTAMCGEDVTITAPVYNIGDEDQKQVKVTLFNKELGINLENVIKGLDQGDKENVEFAFTIPDNAKEKQYILEFSTEYSYDKKNDRYKDSSDVFETTLKVEGGCSVISQKAASITAALDSDAIAGQQLAIKGEITNSGKDTTTYSLYATAYNSWATLERIEPSTVTLDAGESKEFFIYLNVNDDIVGEQSLTIKADYGTGVVDQDVSVAIEEDTGTNGGITGQAIIDHLRANWFIWVIVIINVVLILAIIVVARRIVTSK